MRIVRQQRTNLHPNDSFVIRVWKKNVYIKGWYILIQFTGRCWIVMPSKPKNPPTHGRK